MFKTITEGISISDDGKINFNYSNDKDIIKTNINFDFNNKNIILYKKKITVI
jgi:hypothetical protein